MSKYAPVELKDLLLWTAGQAAIMCGVSQSTFNKLVREGKMPQPRVGKKFSSAEIRRALNVIHSQNSEVDLFEEWNLTNG